MFQKKTVTILKCNLLCTGESVSIEFSEDIAPGDITNIKEDKKIKLKRWRKVKQSVGKLMLDR